MTAGGPAAGRRAAAGALGWLPAALGAGFLAGVVGGAVAGRHHLVAGYPLLALDGVRRGVAWGLAGAAAFLLVYSGVRALLRRPAGSRGAVLAAAAVALVPLLAVAGAHANRAWGFRPSDLAAGGAAFGRNLGLVAAAAAIWVLVSLLLLRAERRPPPGALAGRRRAVAALAVIAAALVLHLGVAAGLGAPAAGKGARPDVLVVLVDALRADHLGVAGYPRPTTPALDALAADGVTFTQAVAASTFTKSSIASLFTGRQVFQHGVYQGSQRESAGRVTSDLLGEAENTLAETFRRHGYLTQGWVQNSHLRGFMGFAQGFVDYRDQQGSVDRIARLFERWAGGPGGRYPFFAYLHLIDLHDPYRPPPPYDAMFGDGGPDPYAGIDLAEWGGYLEAVRRGERRVEPERLARMRDLYDGQLRRIDDRLGEVFARLRELGLYDRTLIVVTSDHGDAFGEHGFISHSTTPYEELVRVPLIVKLPGNRFAGRRVERAVRLVDLYPTLADLAGIGGGGGDGGPPLAGCSLVPLMRGGDRRGSAAGAGTAAVGPVGGAEPADRSGRDPACAVAVIEIAGEAAGEEPTVAVRTEGWKLIRFGDGREELYHLADDPGERNDLAVAAPPEGAPLTALRAVADRVVADRGAGGGRLVLDEEQIRDFKSLGYIP